MPREHFATGDGAGCEFSVSFTRAEVQDTPARTNVSYVMVLSRTCTPPNKSVSVANDMQHGGAQFHLFRSVCYQYQGGRHLQLRCFCGYGDRMEGKKTSRMQRLRRRGDNGVPGRVSRPRKVQSCLWHTPQH